MSKKIILFTATLALSIGAIPAFASIQPSDKTKPAVIENCDLLPVRTGRNWEFQENTNDITVYRSEVAGTSIVAFKGCGSIEAPTAKVISTIMDYTRATEWVDSLDTAKVLRIVQPSTDFYVYNHFGTPFVIKDRDFVTHVRVEIDSKRQAVILHQDSEEISEAPQTSYIRGSLKDSTFVIQCRDNCTKTWIEAEIFADPQGSVPKWIVNLFQRAWPRTTMESLRKQVLKADIQELPFFKNLPSLFQNKN